MDDFEIWGIGISVAVTFEFSLENSADVLSLPLWFWELEMSFVVNCVRRDILDTLLFVDALFVDVK